MEDFQAWQKYPQVRNWFNKLYVASRLGYDCGPGGIPPTKSGYYCVRPTYNIGGMSVGARKQWICTGDASSVEPGYFWCEWFEGDQYSTTYKLNILNYDYEQISCFKADRGDELYKFKKWSRSALKFDIHPIIENILESMIEYCNIETIGNKVIEVHFRDTPDPDYDEIIPIWSNDTYLIDIYSQMGYSWIGSFDDSNGFLSDHRLGFMVR